MKEKDLNISVLLDFYGDLLSEKQRDAIDLYYNEDLSLAEIADISGITRQGVREAIKKSEMHLCEMEDKLGLAKRFQFIEETVDEMVTALQSLKEKCKDDAEINDSLNRIISLANKLAQ